jgi:hypothetical protein
VDERTLFYSAGGLDLQVGAEGVQLGGGTLASILSASVTFTEPAEKQLRLKPLPDARLSFFTPASTKRISPSLIQLYLTCCSSPAACAG